MIILPMIGLSLGLILILGSLAELIHSIRLKRSLNEPHTTLGVSLIGLFLFSISLFFIIVNY